jgi:hypothetical protein
VYIYNIKDNKGEKVDTGRVAPKPRAGHSAVIYQHSMVIFGGRDEDNEKLNDVWVFDLQSRQWKEEVPSGSFPVPRSGHSACLFKDSIIVFGGILEVTKELDDMHAYDLKSKRWSAWFEEYSASSHSPSKLLAAPVSTIGNSESSPNPVASKQLQASHSNMKSTTKRPGTTMTSPLKSTTKSPGKPGTAGTHFNSPQRPGTTPGKRHRPKLSTSMISAASPPHHKHHHHHQDDSKPVELSSPTSISMKNSYIIKNADASFETYYNSMKKRTKTYQLLNASVPATQNLLSSFNPES